MRLHARVPHAADLDVGLVKHGPKDVIPRDLELVELVAVHLYCHEVLQFVEQRGRMRNTSAALRPSVPGRNFVKLFRGRMQIRRSSVSTIFLT